MSYAAAAATGPKQDPDEVSSLESRDKYPHQLIRAPEPPQVQSTASEATSLVDVDSPHVSSVRSDYESQPVQTSTQAERLGREAEEKARRAGAAVSDAARDAKDKASLQGKKAKSGAKEQGRKLDANKDNPVVIANGVILVVGGAAVGFGAYKRYTEGTLDWKIAGITVGAAGVFAVADYYASQWLFKNRYPPKE